MSDLSSLLKDVGSRERLLPIDAALDPTVVRRVLLNLDALGPSEVGDVIQSLLWHSQLMNNWTRRLEASAPQKVKSDALMLSGENVPTPQDTNIFNSARVKFQSVQEERRAYRLDPVEEVVNYDPDNLFDTLIKRLRVKNDAALSRILQIAPPVISKIRRGSLPIGPSLLLYMHEVSDLSIKELRALMGDHRRKFTIIVPELRPKYR